MKRKILLLMLSVLCLLGCSRTDTMVYVPEEEVVDVRGGTVVYIPVNPTEETESHPTEAPTEIQPRETEYPKENTATLGKKTGSTSSKGSSSNKGSTTGKTTITGSTGQKPPASQPASTEPAVTEAPETQPPETQPPVYDISGYSVGSLEYAMLDQINAHRLDAGLSELSLDVWLCAIASYRSYEASLLWSHTRPDGRGYATVLDDYGYSAGAVQELLVYVSGAGDGAAIADRWMSDDSYRETLLGSFHTAGIGVYRANGFTYVTCLLIG